MDESDYNTTSGPNEQFFCNDCSFVSDSQGGLGVHCVKKHKVEVPDDVKSVSVVCEFPKGKSFYCCICNTIIKSWPNFKRHYINIHPGIELFVSAVCTLCNRQFKELKGAGVHLKRDHDIASSTIVTPKSPSPIMSSIDFVDSQRPTVDTNTHQVPPVSSIPIIPIENTPRNRRNTRSNTRKNIRSNSQTTSISTTPISNNPNPNRMVALNGCTVEDSLSTTPIPDPSHSHVSLSAVAFSGCTAPDSHNPVIECNNLPPLSTTPHVPDPSLCDLPFNDPDPDISFDIPPPLHASQYLPRPTSSYPSRPCSPPPISPPLAHQTLDPHAPSFIPPSPLNTIPGNCANSLSLNLPKSLNSYDPSHPRHPLFPSFWCYSIYTCQ